MVIAEDFVLIQENIRKAVEPSCDVVAVVEDGASALQAVATHSPDILLLDVSLPDMNGFTVFEKLLEAKAEVRVIFLTAHSSQDYLDRAFELGAKAYIAQGADLDGVTACDWRCARGETYRPRSCRSTAVSGSYSAKVLREAPDTMK